MVLRSNGESVDGSARGHAGGVPAAPRRELIEQERLERRQKLLAEMVPGDIRKGTVKNITDFGAFIDLNGIDGLLHITDMSWSRIGHPSEILKVGQDIDVVVLDGPVVVVLDVVAGLKKPVVAALDGPVMGGGAELSELSRELEQLQRELAEQVSDDIARSMSALAVRIAVIPGRSVIGIELPNAGRETVYLRELLSGAAIDLGKYRCHWVVTAWWHGAGGVLWQLHAQSDRIVGNTAGARVAIGHGHGRRPSCDDGRLDRRVLRRERPDDGDVRAALVVPAHDAAPAVAGPAGGYSGFAPVMPTILPRRSSTRLVSLLPISV